MKFKLVVLFLTILTGSLFSVKLTPHKYHKGQSSRIHPFTNDFAKGHKSPITRKDATSNRLLVILVDFQEEIVDDPNTTGNGKFFLEPDPNYLYTVGSPPHDHEYFSANLEALRYYYLAASAGSFDLKYDVYPQVGAYTLPQSMGYYNTPGATSSQFVAKMEEYFKSSFEIADSLSPEIDFSSYSHFMIIHAGSDWQHDVNNDTPSDIPSFYITVSEGKEARVDGGSVLISQACNVPSTISQDFSSQTSANGVFYSGYGALNAVMAHEFGHSLGLRDLYNVYTWQPMVGVFDIMDSGGSGILVDQLQDGSYVLLEGALPILPGAWSRTIAFGDHLQASGLCVDVPDINLYQTSFLAASSFKQSNNSVTTPQILRLPLNDNEYILIENRSVDPDGDGATAVFATPDSRVILYPTPLNDPLNTPSYEYDYLLPSFQKSNGDAVGGGLLVWRVNNDVIHGQGVTDSEGNWYSNYENNSVNTRYSQRGVEIIEADGLPDIGNQWSWYWTGTQYEYFHAKKPILNSTGLFINWSQENWKPALGNTTNPKLTDHAGGGSLYGLVDISHPAPIMQFKVVTGFFDSSLTYVSGTPGISAGPPINSSFNEINIPMLDVTRINLISLINDQWIDLMGDYAWTGQDFVAPVVISDQNSNNFDELVMVHGNSLELVEFSGDTLHTESFNFTEPLITAPLTIDDTLFLATQNKIFSLSHDSLQGQLNIVGIKKLGRLNQDLVVLCSDRLLLLDPRDLYIKAEIDLPDAFGNYDPVCYSTTSGTKKFLYVSSNTGNIYRYDGTELRSVFINTDSSLPTQLGICSMRTSTGTVSPTIFWGNGNKVYAMKFDGTLLTGYPYSHDYSDFTAGDIVYSLDHSDITYLFLPIPGKGFIAFSPEPGIDWNLSLLPGVKTTSAHLFEAEGNFYWYYTSENGDLVIHERRSWGPDSRIQWNGYRNLGSGMFISQTVSDNEPVQGTLSVHVFPNPVRAEVYRVRIEGTAGDVILRVYNINGSLVHKQTVSDNGLVVKDVQLDSRNMSSGVYIMTLESGGEIKSVKFSIEK